MGANFTLQRLADIVNLLLDNAGILRAFMLGLARAAAYWLHRARRVIEAVGSLQIARSDYLI